MDAPAGIDFPDTDHEGENRRDPAVMLVNITPDEEFLETLEAPK